MANNEQAAKTRFGFLALGGTTTIVVGAFSAFAVPLLWRNRTDDLPLYELVYLAFAIVAPLLALGKWFLNRATESREPNELDQFNTAMSEIGRRVDQLETVHREDRKIDQLSKRITDFEARIKQIEVRVRHKEIGKETEGERDSPSKTSS